MEKNTVWLFLSALDHPDACFALATTAWVAKRENVLFDGYLECKRRGDLFAQTGSTVIGGRHFQQFNYLNACADVKLLVLGDVSVFASSAALFGNETIVRADTLDAFYEQLFSHTDAEPECLLFAPRTIPAQAGEGQEDFGASMHNKPAANLVELDIAPYLHAEICFSRAIAYPAENMAVRNVPAQFSHLPKRTLWLSQALGMECVDALQTGDDYGKLTMRLAMRWRAQARGVAFGDPDAIRAQIPTLCMEERVSVYAPPAHKANQDVTLNAYTENASTIAEETANLALEIGNPILVGRQTGDADLFTWGSKGVAIQIMDPNRPAFSSVAYCQHIWNRSGRAFWAEEPDDATLEKWASEGRVLCSIVFHSGEMAHNEAMINLMDLCAIKGIKMGLATHLMRYKTCPQFWELLQVPISRGGMLGLVEPILHSGGLGVMAEKDCPPQSLYKHCTAALAGIREIAGEGGMPVGYYFFCDTDLETLQTVSLPLYRALEKAGLQYAISSAIPGRNRLIQANIPVLTQTSRTQCTGSPFVRITTREDIRESGYAQAPGWFLGVLDSPVIAFESYIWEKGYRFMEILAQMRDNGMVNVLPHTIARYARVLQKRGDLPAPYAGPSL